MAGIPDSESIEQQYRTIAGGAGWLERADRGRLRFTGADAGSFLHALLTNDIDGLPPGAGTYAAYLTPQGRMVSDMQVYRDDHGLLMDVPPGLAAVLASRFDALIFSEDARVEDVTTETQAFLVAGEGAAGVLARACGLDAAAIDSRPQSAHLAVPGGFVARTDAARIVTFEVIVDVASGERVARDLTRAGAAPMTPELVDALRIDAGIPAFGVDMDASTIPLEAGLLERAISTTKGCYVGQEVIVRILHRGGGRVARSLTRVVLGPDVSGLPALGAPLDANGTMLERVTSAAWSPLEHRVVVLGYVKRAPAA